MKENVKPPNGNCNKEDLEDKVLRRTENNKLSLLLHGVRELHGEEVGDEFKEIEVRLLSRSLKILQVLYK